MTANKPMTSEQLDELMTVAVNMQRDSEKAGDRPAAMFAYAVQVAALELRNFRNDAAELEQKLIESERYGRQTDITIDNLEMKLAQMAAENAGLKQAITTHSQSTHFCEVCGKDDPCSTDDVCYVLNETPATDAFLAEVRAQGVEAAIATAKNVVAQEFQYKDFETAQRVCSKFPESDLVGKVEMVEWLEDFAAQLRKGVQS